MTLEILEMEVAVAETGYLPVISIVAAAVLGGAAVATWVKIN